MEVTEIKKVLANLGLSDWETESYLILIRYGPQTALQLSKLTNVARSKTYEVVTRLRRKGLVMKVPPMPTKGVTQKFVAINPKEVFPSKISDIEQLIEHLSNAYNNPKAARYPSINFYTTKENARKFILKLSKESKFLYFYLNDLNLEYVLEYSFDHSIKAINKKKHYFLLANTKELKEFSKKINTFSFSHEKGEGINYIITPDSLILDLWKSQHIFLEIKSKDAVKTFLLSYQKLIK